jgi:hypothetical protein
VAFTTLLCYGWTFPNEKIPLLFMTFVLTALLCSLVAQNWVTYFPFLVGLSAFVSYLLLCVFRRQSGSISQGDPPSLPSYPNPRAYATHSRSTRMANLSPREHEDIEEDLEAQSQPCNSATLRVGLPSGRSTDIIPGPVGRTTDPHSPVPSSRHELSAYAEHR